MNFNHPAVRFLVFDTETIGLDPVRASDGSTFGGVCELSVRQVDPTTLETVEHWHTLLHPEAPISASKWCPRHNEVEGTQGTLNPRAKTFGTRINRPAY